MKYFVITCTNNTIASRLFRWFVGYLKEQSPRPICRVMKMRHEIDFIGLDTIVKFTTHSAALEYVAARYGEITYISEHEVEKFLDGKMRKDTYYESNRIL